MYLRSSFAVSAVRRRPHGGALGDSDPRGDGVSAAALGVDVETVPYEGAPHTIEFMRKAFDRLRSDPRVRLVVEDVTKGLYGKDYLSEVAALYYALTRGKRYLRDPARTELVKDLEAFLKSHGVDCDDDSAAEALVFAVALENAGNFDIDFVTAGFGADGVQTHVFVRVMDPRGSGRYAVLDPVAGPATASMLRRATSWRVYPVSPVRQRSAA